jgi:hypothetical protein
MLSHFKRDTHLPRDETAWGRMSEPNAPGSGSRKTAPQPQATRQNLGSKRLLLAKLCPCGPDRAQSDFEKVAEAAARKSEDNSAYAN